jgi:2-octaprenyl-6-methoxyphenol hydroxylase
VPRDYDCLIVGAGMAGASLALALGGIGLRVAVLDSRQPSPAQRGAADPRGLVLAPASQRILEAVAVWGRLASRIVPIERIHVSDRGRFGFTHLTCDDVGMPALGYVCPADHLMASLEDALETAPGCDVFWSAVIGTVETGAEHLLLKVRVDDAEHSLTGRVLVGADGINSMVRRQANIDVDVRDYEQTAVVANLTVAKAVPATAFERFTRDGPIALLPLNDGRWASVSVLPTREIERVSATSDEEYLHDLAVRFGDRLGAFSDLGERYSFPLKLSRARALVADRCALVGGAANSVHPNAAQGLNLGLRDVAVLAECIAGSANANGDIGAPSCLARYAHARRQDQDRVAVFTDVLARGFTSRLAPIPFTRNAAMLAIDLIPALKRRLMLNAMGLAGPLPRLVREGRL